PKARRLRFIVPSLAARDPLQIIVTLHGWPLVSAPPHSLVGLDCLSGFCMFRSHTWTFRDLRHVSLPSADSTRISTIISALENGAPYHHHRSRARKTHR